ILHVRSWDECISKQRTRGKAPKRKPRFGSGRPLPQRGRSKLGRGVNVRRGQPSIKVGVLASLVRSIGWQTPLQSGNGETALVVAARNGDREAFGILYARYSRMVHGIALAHSVRRDVDDVVQDVFVTALDRLASLRDPGAFGPWLTSIARNRALDHHRARRETV